MNSQHTTEDIVDNFLDIIRGQYKHARSNRGDQFAEWRHFSNEFLKKCADKQLFDVFLLTLKKLEVSEVNAFKQWLGHLLGLSISHKIFVLDVLKGEFSEEKKVEIAQWFIRRLEKNPNEKSFTQLSKEEAELLRPYGYRI